MHRYDIINKLITKFNYKKYLEIGVQANNNFNRINCDYKFGVDPNPISSCDFIGTSDEYFQQLSKDVMFDIVFIDGLHHFDQVLKDIDNSLAHLNENGTIVCHDCLPMTELMQNRQDLGGEWTGDTWKAIANLRIDTIDLEIKVVDTDYGCGIIRRGTNIPYSDNKLSNLDYHYFTMNRNNLMNVISVDEFNKWIDEI